LSIVARPSLSKLNNALLFAESASDVGCHRGFSGAHNV
jgi:hypothetical protein